MRIIFILLLFSTGKFCFSQEEPYLSNQTYTYESAIEQYKNLAEKFPKLCAYQEFGMSD
ncbi:MAG: hypothetical protein IPM77_05180 [Crocinitomicaceae bacterium]|nr:hypothetical protein [Crocinitomicaceae bacterium]